MSYKTTDALMRHLRESGIAISGAKQKRQLVNTGYFHGYKGYRFFGKAQRKLPYVNFKTIGDYIILICYYLKLLKVSKTEIKAFIREFEKITNEYQSSVNPNVSAITIHPDLTSRMTILKNSI